MSLVQQGSQYFSEFRKGSNVMSLVQLGMLHVLFHSTSEVALVKNNFPP